MPSFIGTILALSLLFQTQCTSQLEQSNSKAAQEASAAPSGFALTSNHLTLWVKSAKRSLTRRQALPTLPAPGVDGVTLGHWAVRLNNIEAMTLIDAAGGNFNTADATGQTATHWAARFATRKTIEELRNGFGNFFVLDQEGQSPMHFAAANRGPAEIRAVYLQGVDLDAPDHTGRRPVHLAAATGSAEAIAELAALGADFWVENAAQQNPVAIARAQGRGAAIIAALQAAVTTSALKA